MRCDGHSSTGLRGLSKLMFDDEGLRPPKGKSEALQHPQPLSQFWERGESLSYRQEDLL
jgi:hypothetical protein